MTPPTIAEQVGSKQRGWRLKKFAGIRSRVALACVVVSRRAREGPWRVFGFWAGTPGGPGAGGRPGGAAGRGGAGALNVARRHLNKGQIAIVVAKAYPEPDEVGGRGKKRSTSERFPMVHKAALSDARVIVRYAPELADRVRFSRLWREEDEGAGRRLQR
jgi:hypothetical protein